MEKMYCFSVPIFLFCFGSVISFQIKPKIKMNEIKTEVTDNPYFSSNWGGIIEENGSMVTIDCPVKAEVPDNMMMKIIINAAQGRKLEKEMVLCEAFDDEIIGKDVLEHGRPKSFPKSCNIQPGDTYRIKSWKPPTDKIPDNTPNGEFTVLVYLYEPDMEPYVKIDVKAEIYRD